MFFSRRWACFGRMFVKWFETWKSGNLSWVLLPFFVKKSSKSKKTTNWRMILLDSFRYFMKKETCLPKVWVVIPYTKTRFPNINIFFLKPQAGSPPAFSNNGMHKAVNRKCERWFVCILTRWRKQINPLNCEKHWEIFGSLIWVFFPFYIIFGVNLLQGCRRFVFGGWTFYVTFLRFFFSRPSRVAGCHMELFRIRLLF